MEKADHEDNARVIASTIKKEDKKNIGLKSTLEKEQLKLKTQELTVKDLKHELKTKIALLKKAEKEYAPLAILKHDLEADLGTIKTELFLINKEYEDLRAEVDENNKRIEAKMRERDLLNKDVVLAEEKERDKADVI